MAKKTTSNIHFHDLPDVLLTKILSSISDTRTRNAVSLVCLRWYLLERSTRTSLALRGNIRDLCLIPTCFTAITHLDLSLLSPWGHPLLDDDHHSPNSLFLVFLLAKAFPSIVSITVYARNPSIVRLLAPQWPNLRCVKLVRWHPRSPTAPLGSDILPLLEHCHSLSSLDLSDFYYWTEDLPPALEAHPLVSASLTHLNILTHSLAEGFKSYALLAITAACPNLSELLAACIFDHRYTDFVGEETLLALASNCPRLLLLHLTDTSSSSNTRSNSDDDEHTSNHEGARISHSMLMEFFSRLPCLEELVLDLCQNVRDTWLALELINPKCVRLKSLKLGQFHGIYLHGFALCKGLESLSIKNSADLTDSCLITISHGCPKLAKFEVQGCKNITEMGIRKMACILRQTLVDVNISRCKHLKTKSSLQALEPIQNYIKKLHLDCTWESIQSSEKGDSIGDGLSQKPWTRLQCLSLRFPVGEILTPLVSVGLENCPALEEIQIKVKGDCRHHQRPPMAAFGLSSLACYPLLSKMNLDCSGAIGYTLTAPVGRTDLSLWERFYLNGIGKVKLSELNYWPPQDRDVNRRSLSLPAAGLLAECKTLRKVFIHGTANEHFMMFLLRIPNLRDAQLREDYYPAPDNDITTELRVDSCHRFEDALNRGRVPD